MFSNLLILFSNIEQSNPLKFLIFINFAFLFLSYSILYILITFSPKGCLVVDVVIILLLSYSIKDKIKVLIDLLFILSWFTVFW